MTNEIFITMNDKHTVRTRTQHNTESCNHGSNLFESLINLSVSVTLFTVKSKFSLPYNRALRVKGAMIRTLMNRCEEIVTEEEDKEEERSTIMKALDA